MLFLNFCLSLFFLFLICCIGLEVLKRFSVQIENALEGFVLSAGIGIIFLSYLIFFLGMFGVLYKSVFVTLVLIIALATFKRIKIIINASTFGSFKNFFLGRSTYGQSLIIMCLLGFIFAFFLTGNPVLDIDSLAYHLAVPKLYIENHTISELSFYSSDLPLGLQMIWLAGMLISSNEMPALLSLVISLLAVLSLFIMGSKFFSQEIAFCGSVIFFSMPTFLEHMKLTLVDIGLSFFVVLGIYTLLMWQATKGKVWLVLSGIFVGFCAAVKTFGLLLFPFFWVAVLLIQYKAESSKKKSVRVKKTFLYAFLFFMLNFGLCFPWYYKTYLYRGDPLAITYTASYAKGEQTDRTEKDIVTNFKIVLKNIILRTKKLDHARGMGGSISDFLRILWDITYHSDAWGKQGMVGSVFISFIPLLFILVLCAKIDRLMLLLTAFVIYFFSVWFFLIKQVNLRYLYPIYPVLSLLTGYTIMSFIRISPLLKKVAQAVLLLTVFLNVSQGMALDSKKIPYLLNSDKNLFLKKFYQYHKGCFDVIDYTNRNLTSENVILCTDRRIFYFKPRCIILHDDKKNIYYALYKSYEHIIATFKERGITHVFLRPYGQKGEKVDFRFYLLNGRKISLENDILKNFGIKLYERNGIALYCLNYSI